MRAFTPDLTLRFDEPVYVTIDLDALWNELGVRLRGDRVVYDEGAPLAAIRRAITEVEPR